MFSSKRLLCRRFVLRSCAENVARAGNVDAEVTPHTVALQRAVKADKAARSTRSTGYPLTTNQPVDFANIVGGSTGQHDTEESISPHFAWGRKCMLELTYRVIKCLWIGYTIEKLINSECLDNSGCLLTEGGKVC